MPRDAFAFDQSQIALSSVDLVEYIPHPIAIKTIDSVYVAANQLLAKLAGFLNPRQMIGLQDMHLNCPAAELHNVFVAQDKEALISNKISNLDICTYSDGQLHVFLTIKTKLIDQRGLKFLLFTMTELPIASMTKIMNCMSYDTSLNSNKFARSYPVRYPSFQNVNKEHVLSKRLAECLFLLLQGKSMKAIAYDLKISSRTVEEHINRLKYIFGCSTKFQLVEKAFSLGYAQIIPPSLLNL